MQQTRGILFHCLSDLDSFQYGKTHKTGKNITHADGLSRSDHLPEPEIYELEEQA